MRKNRKYSAEFKIQCVKKILEEHISKHELEREYFNNYRLSSKLHYKSPAQFKIEQGYV